MSWPGGARNDKGEAGRDNNHDSYGTWGTKSNLTCACKVARADVGEVMYCTRQRKQVERAKGKFIMKGTGPQVPPVAVPPIWTPSSPPNLPFPLSPPTSLSPQSPLPIPPTLPFHCLFHPILWINSFYLSLTLDRSWISSGCETCDGLNSCHHPPWIDVLFKEAKLCANLSFIFDYFYIIPLMFRLYRRFILPVTLNISFIIYSLYSIFINVSLFIAP